MYNIPIHPQRFGQQSLTAFWGEESEREEAQEGALTFTQWASVCILAADPHSHTGTVIKNKKQSMLETLWLLLFIVLHCLIYLIPTRYDFPVRSHWRLEECGVGRDSLAARAFICLNLSAQVTLPQLVITVLGFPGSCRFFTLFSMAFDLVTLSTQNNCPLCPISFGSVAWYITAQTWEFSQNEHLRWLLIS